MLVTTFQLKINLSVIVVIGICQQKWQFPNKASKRYNIYSGDHVAVEKLSHNFYSGLSGFLRSTAGTIWDRDLLISRYLA